jgi:hypothetical protein
MAGDPQQGKAPLKYHRVPQLSILKGDTLAELLARRSRSNTPAVCSKCGLAIRPGDVILKKEYMGHLEFLHSKCCFSRPHISEPRPWRPAP